MKPKKIDFKPKLKMKGKSKTGRIEARKKSVKDAAIREYVKEVQELKRNNNKNNNNTDNDDVNQNKLLNTVNYNPLDRFNKKKLK